MSTRAEYITEYLTEYRADRAYFGDFTDEALSSAIETIKKTQNWDKPTKIKKEVRHTYFQ